MSVVIAVISVFVVATVVLGVIFIRKERYVLEHPRLSKRVLGANFSSFAVLLVSSVVYMMVGNHAFAQAAAGAAGAAAAGAAGLGYLGAGLSTGLAAIGAGIGVGVTGSSAIGAISEKPELLGRTLIYIGLAEGIAIYGLIISVMILGRV